MSSVVVSVRLDERVVSAIDRVGRERSEVIREAVDEWLRRRQVAEMVREHEAGYRRSPVGPEEFGWLLDAAVWPDEEGNRLVSVAPTRSDTRARKEGRAKRGRRA